MEENKNTNELSEQDWTFSDSEKKPSQNKKNISKKAVLITVIAVVAVLLISGGVYCVVTDQNPIEAVQGAFTADEEKLIAKWESQTAPGLSAYVFYENGTYDSYLSSYNFSGTYTVSGNKISLKNPDTAKQITYKFSISGDVLTLTLVEENGEEAEEQEVSKYNKVEELNQKSLTDLLQELTTAQSSEEEEEETTEEPDLSDEDTEQDESETEDTSAANE